MNHHPELLDRKKAAFLIIDAQERVLNVMKERETVAKAIKTLIKGCRILNVPILFTEQYPPGLGRTNGEILALLDREQVIEKTCFSSCAEKELLTALATKEIQQVLVAGIEAHVCVLQTAFDLKNLGYQVQVVRQAVASRNEIDLNTALQRMHRSGIIITTVESALFELLEVSGTAEFKEISKLIK